MAEVLRQDIDFNGLFKKLSHHLGEIRVRALENILSKLEHKLICDADIVRERQLFIRLLEWFNFPKSSRHADILGLLLRLSQHTAAAETLQDIGAIEFLTQLRSDVSPSLQPMVDQILENTMRLPEVQPSQHAPECIYQKHERSGFTAGLETTVDSAMSRRTAEQTMSSVGEAYQQPDPQTLPDYRDPPLGYFEQDFAPSSMLPQQTDGATASSACFRMSTFPWLALSPTDRHVIVSTNSSLQSRETSLLISTCEFLSDVVFQDFPAEIFLQRPNIIKNLLSLMTAPPQSGTTKLVSHAARTLADFTTCLRCRIKYYQDPSLYTPKQDFSATPSAFSTPSSTSSDSRPSVVGLTHTRHRGDGRDGDSDSSRSSQGSSLGFSPAPLVEETDFEDMQALQFIQMTLPQFCATILEKGLPLLQTNQELVALEIMHLLNETLDIMVYVLTPDLWEDTSVAAREVIDKLTDGFEAISNLLRYHHHGNTPTEQTRDDCMVHNDTPGDLVHHRIVYIGIAVFLSKFLRTLVPVQKSGDILPVGLVSSINALVFDEALSHSHPEVQICFLGYLQHLDAEKYRTYVATATVCQAMQRTCRFLMMSQDETHHYTKETAALADAAIPSLPYHIHLPFVTEVVALCADVCSRSKCSSSLQSQWRGILLKLLSHPVTQIQQHCYTNVLNIVQDCLRVGNAIEPGSTSHEKVKFLFDSKILYEIIVFGLANKVSKVSSTASDLLSHLLRSQLLTSTDLWQIFISSLLHALPVLQSYACLDTKLGTAVLTMLEPRSRSSSDELSVLEKFRGTLRCMLSADVRVRTDCLKRLSWFLSNEENSDRKLPEFADLDVSNLGNIFIVDTPRSVDEDLGRSVFQVDGLRKVYEIFTSLNVDPGVKKSAVDQLAIILQDPSLHLSFRKDGGLEKILEHIQIGVMKDGDTNTNNYTPYLPGCVTILRYLVHHDYTLRHKLAHDQQIYYMLLRVALLYNKDERTCYEVSHLLTLLLFDEVAKFDLGNAQKSTMFSIPAVLKKRYRLPFRATTHHEDSPNKVTLAADPDPVQSGLPWEMLRLTWNVAWHNGMEQLLNFLGLSKSQQKDFPDFSPKLRLLPTDKIILQSSHVKHCLQQGVYNTSNATSHTSVSKALLRILSHLVALHDTKDTAVFNTLDWCSAIGRFVKVTPSSSADESLLLDILRFISMVLRLTNHIPDNILQWIGEVLYSPKGPLIGLLHRTPTRETVEEASEPLVSVKRSLDKALLAFIANYNSSLPYVLCVRLKFHQLRGDLSRKLLLRLNVTDAPHFYNLASLEGTLQCLMHITARPGWSQECTEVEGGSLCSQMLNCLLEVVSAFHIGRGGTSMSFMGKGVTKAATLCLRHLVYEMATHTEDKNWPKNWLYSRHGTDSIGEPGLNWMLTLWAYRDPEVRTAGLGIAVALTSTEPGRMMVASNCKHIPGGIWGAAFSILLDQSECSMVRQQASLLLVNLTSQSLPPTVADIEQNGWQGPVVTDTDLGVSLIGLPALLALLHHSQFYREMMILLSNYCPQPAIQPVIADVSYHLSANTTDTTLSTSVPDAGPLPKFGGLSSFQQQAMSASQTSGKVDAQVAAKHTPNTTASSSGTNTPTRAFTQTKDADNSENDSPREVSEYQSVTTPCLVSAVAQLFRNLIILAPQDTLTAIKSESLLQFFVSLMDVSFLEGIQTLSTSDQMKLFFSDIIRMHTDILGLLQTCLVYDTSTRIEMCADRTVLGSVVSLLRITSEGGEDLKAICADMWKMTLSFLMILLQLQTSSALQVLTQVMSKQWADVSEILKNILEDCPGGDRDLLTQCLQFLSVLFSEEGKLQARCGDQSSDVTMTTLLNSPLNPDCEDKDESQVSAGSKLCKALVGMYDACILRSTEQITPMEKINVITTLRTLLAISQSAKITALEMGLVENLIEHIKQTHVKLNMASLQVGKPSNKAKDNTLVDDLVLTFDLLRNFMFQSEDVKMSCYHCGLHNIVHRMWAWCQTEPPLMSSVLALLTTYTAKCPTAASSLAYTSATGTTNAPAAGVKPGLSGNSLVHCLVKLVSKEGQKEGLLKSVFSLLSTLSLSSECRNIIWKSNLLRDFADLNPKKSKKSRKKQSLEVMWLDLLVNLSFSTEGQQMILKIPECVDLLLEFMELPTTKQQESAALVIRNLCCHAPNKPKLLSNENLIPGILGCMSSGSEKLSALVASALWALIFNNQKAKVILKNANIVPKLQETLNTLSTGKESQLLEKCTGDLQAVIATVTE